MQSRDELVALLRPLVSRLCVTHCWIKSSNSNGPRHIAEPFDEVKLSEHVSKHRAYGLCPITPGESTCQVAALDFDDHKRELAFEEVLHAAETVLTALEMDGLMPAMFTSSSGHGIHIYLLWDTPQDAYSVRMMLSSALASCGFAVGTGGVKKKSIEVYPKQDAVGLDEVGSMFILPFSGESRFIQ